MSPISVRTPDLLLFDFPLFQSWLSSPSHNPTTATTPPFFQFFLPRHIMPLFALSACDPDAFAKTFPSRAVGRIPPLKALGGLAERARISAWLKQNTNIILRDILVEGPFLQGCHFGLEKKNIQKKSAWSWQAPLVELLPLLYERFFLTANLANELGPKKFLLSA